MNTLPIEVILQDTLEFHIPPGAKSTLISLFTNSNMKKSLLPA